MDAVEVEEDDIAAQRQSILLSIRTVFETGRADWGY